MMKINNYIYILGATLTLFTACGDEVDPVYTVGEEDNAIVLQAGVAETSARTRAAGNPTYNAFTQNTALALRVDGTWLQHEPVDIIAPTTGTIKAEDITSDRDLDGNDDTNTLTDTRGISMSPQLYWDDFGTADPNNKSKKNSSNEEQHPGNGRDKGLTIYGAAVDGLTSLPDGLTNISNWEAVSWTLDANQTNGWTTKDLLYSNNIKDGKDGTLKFDDWFNKNNPKNLLKFTHAMSKVTVLLHAGDGFPNHFVENVTVTLLGFPLSGTVNVVDKNTTITDTTTPDVTTKMSNGVVGPGGEGNPTPTNDLTFDALVFPGRTLNETDEIVKIVADGNEYFVKSKGLYDKMPTSDKKMKDGTNYVIDITVNKTDIDIEASIVNWSELRALNETPVININKTYGDKKDAFNKESFDFYHSASINGNYFVPTNHASVTVGGTSPSQTFTMVPQLYWPNHSIHYFFRGIWPLEGTEEQTELNKSYIPSLSYNKADNSSIKVENVKYNSGTFPSDLMIGMPITEDSETYKIISDEFCKINVDSHKTDGKPKPGICATEGKINLNFNYMMSQVIVNLETTQDADGNPVSNSVTFDENTVVEILNGYTEGEILLGTRTSAFTGKTPSVYLMNKETDGIYNKFHDAIIPQSLTNPENNILKFNIKVKADDGYYDQYETVLGIKDIKVQEVLSGGSLGTAKNIDHWEPGKIYTYTLTITKTGITVTATITDWLTVSGSTTVVM